MKLYSLNVYDAIEEHGRESSDKEVCGIISSTGDEFIVTRCYNYSKTPEKSFIISQEDMTAISENSEIVGFYHSHIGGEPISWVDKTVAEYLNYDCLVYDYKKDEVNIYNPDGKWKAPLVDRPYLIGVFDCLSLAVDYLRTQGIKLTNNLSYNRYIIDLRDLCKKDGRNKLIDFFLEHKFKKTKKIDKNTVIIFEKDNSFNLCGIVLEDDTILCQPYDKRSGIFNISEIANSSIITLKYTNI